MREREKALLAVAYILAGKVPERGESLDDFLDRAYREFVEGVRLLERGGREEEAEAE